MVELHGMRDSEKCDLDRITPFEFNNMKSDVPKDNARWRTPTRVTVLAQRVSRLTADLRLSMS